MLLTVFTPTYNRAGTLPRLFESLKWQTFTDFEWLIVDDGSTDDTERVVTSFDSAGRFPIRYIKKENGGKHTAYNVGLDEAKGTLFFNVDSDDWLKDESLLVISQYAEIILSNNTCSGLIALKSYADGRVIGREFRTPDKLMSFREIELSGQQGERSIVFKTSEARKHKFPIIVGERFMTESVVYDEFTQLKFLMLNESLTVCEYQKDGLSSSPKALMIKNPGGYVLYYRNRIDMAATLRERVGYILRYNFFKSLYKGSCVNSYKGSYSVLVNLLRVVTPLVARFYKV